VVQRLNSQWWLGYVFWLAGTATLFLIRPRDQRWLLLIAFNYLTAIWLTAGTTSSWHVWSSGLVLRSAVWLSVPVYLHLHWAFPSSLNRLPAPVLLLGYGAAFLLAVLQWFQVIPASAYLFGFLLALLGSIVLLLLHVALRPADRREVGFLAAAVALVALPPISMSIATLLGAELPGPLRGASFLAFPADRKSTRLNSSHVKISYAAFCSKKKKHHRSKSFPGQMGYPRSPQKASRTKPKQR